MHCLSNEEHNTERHVCNCHIVGGCLFEKQTLFCRYSFGIECFLNWNFRVAHFPCAFPSVLASGTNA